MSTMTKMPPISQLALVKAITATMPPISDNTKPTHLNIKIHRSLRHSYYRQASDMVSIPSRMRDLL